MDTFYRNNIKTIQSIELRSETFAKGSWNHRDQHGEGPDQLQRRRLQGRHRNLEHCSA